VRASTLREVDTASEHLGLASLIERLQFIQMDNQLRSLEPLTLNRQSRQSEDPFQQQTLRLCEGKVTVTRTCHDPIRIKMNTICRCRGPGRPAMHVHQRGHSILAKMDRINVVTLE
jgi:hypothetical protein